MIPLIINTQDIYNQFNVTKQDVENIVDFITKEITTSFARRWDTQARNELHSSRQVYRESLQVIDEGRMQGSVVLWYTNPLVSMIEEGAGSFDMKEGYAKSSKKKTKKDGGWYMHIPFRFATPNALGEDNVFSAKMPQEIYDLVKDKPQDLITSSGAKASKPLALSEIPTRFQVPATRGAVSSLAENKTFAEYKNKTSIFEGMQKRKDSITGQNTYMSFRTVSDNSDSDAFIHTGINAYNLADKAMSDLENGIQIELGNATDNALKTYGFL